MTENGWAQDARTFATRLAEETSARLVEEELTPKLLRFVFTSDLPGTATINMVVSAFEIILGSGAGTWIELGPIATSGPRAIELVRAVAAGGLAETISRGRVRFELTLADGEVVRGGTSSLLPASRPRKRVSYAPYTMGPSAVGTGDAAPP